MSKPKLLLLLILSVAAILGAFYATKNIKKPTKDNKTSANKEIQIDSTSEIQNGDLIFQTSQSRQCKAIQLATHSKYSHCGIIYKKGNEFFVFEAVQPVKHTPLNDWIAHGKDGEYVIKRLKNAKTVLTSETLKKMRQIGKDFDGKNYDIHFGWSDEKIYCSELVWKIYQRATGIEIGKLQKLGEFDLSHNLVKEILKERYGDNIPLQEPVISPVGMFNSDLLITVKEE